MNGSKRVLAFAVAAPASVVIMLLFTRHLLWTFVVYHVAFCTLVPLLESRYIARRSWPDVAAALGLATWPKRRFIATAVAFAAMAFGGMVGGFLLFGDLLLARADPVAVLAGWGFEATQAGWLFIYMLLMNSGAEELFWRGYVLRGMPPLGRRLGIVAPTALFASYHWFTITVLAGSVAVGFVGMLGVYAGGHFWAWLTRASGSLWPAIIAHVGATAGYMTVFMLLAP